MNAMQEYVMINVMHESYYVTQTCLMQDECDARVCYDQCDAWKLSKYIMIDEMHDLFLYDANMHDECNARVYHDQCDAWKLSKHVMLSEMHESYQNMSCSVRCMIWCYSDVNMVDAKTMQRWLLQNANAWLECV